MSYCRERVRGIVVYYLFGDKVIFVWVTAFAYGKLMLTAYQCVYVLLAKSVSHVFSSHSRYCGRRTQRTLHSSRSWCWSCPMEISAVPRTPSSTSPLSRYHTLCCRCACVAGHPLFCSWKCFAHENRRCFPVWDWVPQSVNNKKIPRLDRRFWTSPGLILDL